VESSHVSETRRYSRLRLRGYGCATKSEGIGWLGQPQQQPILNKHTTMMLKMVANQPTGGIEGTKERNTTIHLRIHSKRVF
jgi:hypothetical protein